MRAISSVSILLVAAFLYWLSWLIWPDNLEGKNADLFIAASITFGGLGAWLIVVALVIVLSDRGGRT